jgi:hypothetical protein
VRIQSAGKLVAKRNVDLVFRQGDMDVALVHFTQPIPSDLLTPPLLMKDAIKGKQKVFIKKVSSNTVWGNIPAIGKTSNWYVSEAYRKGKAGTSGSPWLVHSTEVGDVLVGITHGTGRAPQIGFIKNWIAETVAKNSDDQLYWVTAKQAFAGQKEERKAFEAREAAAEETDAKLKERP